MIEQPAPSKPIRRKAGEGAERDLLRHARAERARRRAWLGLDREEPQPTQSGGDRAGT